MDFYILFKYIHIVSVFVVVGSLVGQLILVQRIVSQKEMRILSRLDNLYGFGSILFVGAGLVLWFGVGKPADSILKIGYFILK